MVAESNHPPEDETDRRITRRGLIRGGAAVAGVGLWHGSRPALAVEFEEANWSADDASITTHDGSITAVNVNPEVSITWEGFNLDEAGTDLYLEIEVGFPEEGGLTDEVLGVLLPDEPVTLYDETRTLDETSGERTFDLDEKDLTDGDDIEEEAFEAENSETNETEVELTLTVDADEDGIESATASTTFTVTVENLEASMEVTEGTVETSVESDEEV